MKISNFDSWNKVLKLIFDVFCDRLWIFKSCWMVFFLVWLKKNWLLFVKSVLKCYGFWMCWEVCVSVDNKG